MIHLLCMNSLTLCAITPTVFIHNASWGHVKPSYTIYSDVLLTANLGDSEPYLLSFLEGTGLWAPAVGRPAHSPLPLSTHFADAVNALKASHEIYLSVVTWSPWCSCLYVCISLGFSSHLKVFLFMLTGFNLIYLMFTC